MKRTPRVSFNRGDRFPSAPQFRRVNPLQSRSATGSKSHETALRPSRFHGASERGTRARYFFFFFVFSQLTVHIWALSL